MESLPWEIRPESERPGSPAMVVDLRRCIGCHACSVACKVEHGVPLGEFRMRVRWMEDPADGRIAFLPVFDAATCDYGSNRARFGLSPACVDACPTRALIFGDGADPDDALRSAAVSATELSRPGDTKPGVLYVGLQAWQEEKLNEGVALDPADEDIIYEQGASR